jgi:hypothetical protein
MSLLQSYLVETYGRNYSKFDLYRNIGKYQSNLSQFFIDNYNSLSDSDKHLIESELSQQKALFYIISQTHMSNYFSELYELCNPDTIDQIYERRHQLPEIANEIIKLFGVILGRSYDFGIDGRKYKFDLTVFYNRQMIQKFIKSLDFVAPVDLDSASNTADYYFNHLIHSVNKVRTFLTIIEEQFTVNFGGLSEFPQDLYDFAIKTDVTKIETVYSNQLIRVCNQLYELGEKVFGSQCQSDYLQLFSEKFKTKWVQTDLYLSNHITSAKIEISDEIIQLGYPILKISQNHWEQYQKLQMDLLQILRILMDINIHRNGLSVSEISDQLSLYFNWDETLIESEIYRCLALPGHYLACKPDRIKGLVLQRHDSNTDNNDVNEDVDNDVNDDVNEDVDDDVNEDVDNDVNDDVDNDVNEDTHEICDLDNFEKAIDSYILKYNPDENIHSLEAVKHEYIQNPIEDIKSEATVEVPQSEEIVEVSQSEATVEVPQSENLQETTKVITPEADVKVVTPEADVKVVTSEADVKVVTSEADVKVVTSEADVKVVTSEADVKVITSEADVKVVTPEADVKTSHKLNKKRGKKHRKSF